MTAAIVAERKSVRRPCAKISRLTKVGLRDSLKIQRRELLLRFLYSDLNVRSQICPVV